MIEQDNLNHSIEIYKDLVDNFNNFMGREGNMGGANPAAFLKEENLILKSNSESLTAKLNLCQTNVNICITIDSRACGYFRRYT
jgi:hypothetical protein